MNGGALITAKASGLKADTVVMQVGDADVTAGGISVLAGFRV